MSVSFSFSPCSSTVQNAPSFQPKRAATVLSTPWSPSFSEAASASRFCTA